MLLECSLKPSALCIAAVENARAALFLVKRSFVNLTPAVFLPLYCILVRLHLEYSMQATSPYSKKEVTLKGFKGLQSADGKKNYTTSRTFNVCNVSTCAPLKTEDGWRI